MSSRTAYLTAFTILALAFSVEFRPAFSEAAASVPLGIDLGPSGPVAPGKTEGRASVTRQGGAVQLAHEGHADAEGTGTVNKIDAAHHSINISHKPIPKIGFPAMTMDFAVEPAVDLSRIHPGSQVGFTLERNKSGMFEINSLKPIGGGK
jgi:Cu/Ag efflux protein CusF